MTVGMLEHNKYHRRIKESIRNVSDLLFIRDPYIRQEAKIEFLFVRLSHYIGPEVLNNFDNLKAIYSPTTGLNHIDVHACQARGIQVISLKGEYEFLESVRATPEYTLLMALNLLRNVGPMITDQTNAYPGSLDRDNYKGGEMCGRKVGIIGLGRVGKLLAKYLQSMDAEIFYFDPIEHNYRYTELQLSDLIATCSIIFLTASYESAGQILTPELIDEMRGKYFVNSARGELIDEEYLFAKVNQGWFAGVAIDVFSDEQRQKEKLMEYFKLCQQHNVFLSPHVAGCTYESTFKTEQFILQKFLDNL